MDERSNTPQNTVGKPFTRGDPRINRKGRPVGFDALRALALQIAHEAAIQKDGQPLVINGHKVTTTEVILRQWSRSGNPILQRAFIEIAFGKVPDKLEVSGTVGHDVSFTAEDIAEARRILGDASNGA
jgi:hypothetical protein